MADRISMLQGVRVDGRKLFAAVDPSSRYVSPQVCQFRFSASLAPYPSEAAAREALAAAGAADVGEVGR